MSKEIVSLKSAGHGSIFEVIKLTNRLQPVIGSVITKTEAEDLIMEAKRPWSNLTVQIS